MPRTQGMTLEDLWEEAELKPNPNQKKAILHIDGPPHYLSAGFYFWRDPRAVMANVVMKEGMKSARYLDPHLFTRSKVP
jgi:hypothetical protein